MSRIPPLQLVAVAEHAVLVPDALQAVENLGDVGVLPVAGGHDDGVEQAERGHQGVHKGDHVAAGHEHRGGQGVQGRHGAVGDGHHVCPPVPGEADPLDGGLGVPGEADAHQHVPRPDAQDALQNVPRAVAGHQRHMLKDQVKIEVEIPRQKGAGPDPQDIDVPGRHHPVHGLPEGGAVHLLNGDANLLHIHLEHGGHHVRAEQPVIGGLNPLNGGQLPPDQFLEGLLHGGVSVGIVS